MPLCDRCNKMLSSRQALDKHMRSRSCVRGTSEHNEQLARESYAVLRCSPDGVIINCKKKPAKLDSPCVRMFSVVGTSVYDVLSCDHDGSCCSGCKYDFAMKHVKLLANPGSAHRMNGVRVKDVISGSDRTYDCVITMRDDEMYVHLNIAP